MTPPDLRRRLFLRRRQRHGRDDDGVRRIVLVTGAETVDEVGETLRADVDDVHLEHVLVVQCVDVFIRWFGVDDVLVGSTAAGQIRRDAKVAHLHSGVNVLTAAGVTLAEQRRQRNDVLLTTSSGGLSLLRFILVLALPPVLDAAVLGAPCPARVEPAVRGAAERRSGSVGVAGMIAAVSTVELHLPVFARRPVVGGVVRVARVRTTVCGAGGPTTTLPRRDVLARRPLVLSLDVRRRNRLAMHDANRRSHAARDQFIEIRLALFLVDLIEQLRRATHIMQRPHRATTARRPGFLRARRRLAFHVHPTTTTMCVRLRVRATVQPQPTIRRRPAPRLPLIVLSYTLLRDEGPSQGCQEARRRGRLHGHGM